MTHISKCSPNDDQNVCVSVAYVETPSAAKYLSQLCKHFAHKIPVHYVPADDSPNGSALFPWGMCLMSAEHGALILKVAAPTGGDVEKVKDVVVSHLERFSWREKLVFNWTPSE